MNTYDTFVQELKKRALEWAKGTVAVTGTAQAENDAVHMVGYGMALVPVDDANRAPEEAALSFARDKASKGTQLFDESAQWALCPLSQHDAFLRLVDVGAAARDELQHQGHGDRIRQDAAAIVEPADLDGWAINPLSAAIHFLTAWPDLGHFSAAAWLRKAYLRKKN